MSTLLDEASLIVTPNGYKAGKLYSVVPSSGAGDLDVTRATTATRVKSSGLIESVASNVPRLDYSNGSCPSILVEPQRTNIATYSEEANNILWNATNCSITANNVISPSGIQNADTATTTSNNSFLGRAIAISPDSSTYTQSVFVKWVSGYEFFKFRTALTGGSSVAKESVFNLRTGAYISGDTTYQIENYGNGWFRFSHQITNNSTNVIFNYQIFNTNDSTQTQSASFWGMQAEAGSYATSYIPTTSASVTRNADVISKTGISSLIGQTEGVIFFDFVYTQLDINGLIPITIIQNSSNHVYFYIDGNEKIYFDFIYSGVDVVSIETANGFAVKGQRYKVAFAYKQNDFVVYINGVQIGTDNSGLIPSFNEIYFGYPYAIGYTYPSTINAVALWTQRLTNSQLAQLTTI
jgi:hypothetical protein